MAIAPRHVKARIFRDYLIEQDMLKSFGEHEVEEGILFAGTFILGEDKRQFIIPIDDTPYTNVQFVIADEVPKEKRTKALELMNTLNLEFPIIKYSIAKTNQLIASFVFHGDEKNFNAERLVMNVLQVCQNINAHQYKDIKEVIG